MPFPSYAALRPFLFRLDAETAHHLTMNALAATQGTRWSCFYRQPLVEDAVELAGLRFPNRVGLAAGLDKNARCIDAFGDMGFGFVEVGTVTPRPQPGNPQPRMFRLPQAQALINRLGFNNDGLQAFIQNVQRANFRQQGRILGLNIGKNADTPIENAVDDYLLGLDAVYPYADYVTVNISSPNTQNLRSLQTEHALDALLEALSLRRETLRDTYDRHVPLFIKIAPDLDDFQIHRIAEALMRHSMDGVIATNTTLSRHGVEGLTHSQEAGGLSGIPVREASTRVIKNLRHFLGPYFPIIGVGGIMSAADALEKLQAGANVVQIYSGLIYRGPELVNEVAQHLKAHAPVASTV